MGHKTTCPGCSSHSSSVYVAFRDDQPCPFCGLSAAAANEITHIRGRRADEALTKAYEELRIKLDKVQQERDKYFEQLEQVRSVVEVDLSNL